MTDPIIIDGSKFGASGTLLRCALAFSAITQKSFVIEKLFLERKFPGLSAQKVALVEAFANTTSAQVAGNGVGSTVLQFYPKLPFSAKNIEIDFSSATNVALPFHSLLIPAIVSKQKTDIRIKGATHIKNAPNTTFIKETLIRYLTPYFELIHYSVPLIGFYPNAGGELHCTTIGRLSIGDLPKPLDVKEQEDLVAIKGELISSDERLSDDTLRRINSLLNLSLKKFGVPLMLQPQYVKSQSSGASLTLAGLFGGVDGFDNFHPHIVALDKTWSTVSSLDNDILETDCVDFATEFSRLVAKKYVDMPSVELLLPFIAILGGSIDVGEISDRINSIIYVAKYLLEVDFKVEDSKISTKGYLSKMYDELPSIEDI